jgi:flavin reductase (DIM6/NTAB) family NADH-FMN oxidoreductase RutF
MRQFFVRRPTVDYQSQEIIALAIPVRLAAVLGRDAAEIGEHGRHQAQQPERKPAMKLPAKTDFPVSQVRRYLEPGPIVLVSSKWQGKNNIMTLGWHTILEFSPSLVGLMISSGNHSHRMILNSRTCVINLATTALTDTVVGIGNTSGAEVDKFAKFNLTAEAATKVDAPLIGECHASFECRLHDDALVEKYNFFIFEVVKAHVAASPRHPETLHYTGDGVFVVSGKVISRRSLFRPEML